MNFFIAMMIFFMWLGAVLCIASMAKFTPPETPGDQLKDITLNGKVYGLSAFFVVVILWVL